MAIFTVTCPSCQCPEFKRHTNYETEHNGRKDIYCCINCEAFFSSSANTFLAGIRKPVSLIMTVLKARTEGLGLNAACPVPLKRFVSAIYCSIFTFFIYIIRILVFLGLYQIVLPTSIR